MGIEAAQRAYDRQEPEEESCLARREREAAEDWELRVLRLQCTNIKSAEEFVADWIADPHRFAGEMVRVVALCGGDHAEIGRRVEALVHNEWLSAARTIAEGKE